MSAPARKTGVKAHFQNFVKKAFNAMNSTFQMKLNGESKNIIGWRLFQIVFIVSLIPEMIVRSLLFFTFNM